MRGVVGLAVGLLVVSSGAPAQDTVRVRADGPPQWGSNVRLVPEVVIGTLDGPPEYAFGRIYYGGLEPTGGFYLFDQNDNQIRHYDARGRFTGPIGRKGSGPGEYGDLGGIDVTRDTLLVVQDMGNLRVTYFDAAGQVRRAFRVARGGFYGSRFVMDSTELVYYQTSLPGGPAEGPGARYQYLRYRPDGTVHDSIPVPPIDRAVGRTFWLSTSDGMRWNFVERDLVAPYGTGGVLSGQSHAYRVVVDNGRSRVLVIERGARRVPLGSAERNEWEAWAQYMASRPPGRRYEIPREKPYIRALESDHLGRIWVDVFVEAEKRNEPPRPPGDARPLLTWKERTTYDVFSPSGAYLGRVRLPAQGVILDILGDRLLVRTRGSDDEERVGVYRIQR